MIAAIDSAAAICRKLFRECYEIGLRNVSDAQVIPAHYDRQGLHNLLREQVAQALVNGQLTG